MYLSIIGCVVHSNQELGMSSRRSNSVCAEQCNDFLEQIGFSPLVELLMCYSTRDSSGLKQPGPELDDWLFVALAKL